MQIRKSASEILTAYIREQCNKNWWIVEHHGTDYVFWEYQQEQDARLEFERRAGNVNITELYHAGEFVMDNVTQNSSKR